MEHVPTGPGALSKRAAEKGSLLRWLHPDGNDTGNDPGAFDPGAAQAVVDRLSLVFGPRRYFRVSVRGFERVPPAPVMMVSNHSGGTTVLDAWGFGWAWYRHFGTSRPIHPAAHEIILGNALTGPYFAKLGVIRADRRTAMRTLAAGHDLLVMPGGDVDVWRPFKDRYRVCFAGRKGYAALALAAGVPIVPLANAGAHESLLVITTGKRIAEALRLPRIARAHIWPIHLSLPWGLAVGPWPHLPLPVHLRYRIGPPVHPSEVGASDGPPTDAQIDALDELVRARLQDQLDALRNE